MNRETYLNNFIDTFALNLFEKKGYDLKAIRDNIKVTCSITTRKKAIGQHFDPMASTGGFNEILISPFIQDSVKVLGVMVHELVHAVIGNENGHNHVFKRCATAVGLEGKMTATSESEWLVSLLYDWIRENGEYPHKAMIKLDSQKKQTTRLLKYVCTDTALNPDTNKLEQGYFNVRVTQGVIDNFGEPICPCGGCEGSMVHESEQIENKMREIWEETV